MHDAITLFEQLAEIWRKIRHLGAVSRLSIASVSPEGQDYMELSRELMQGSESAGSFGEAVQRLHPCDFIADFARV
jgi:RecJ-like exonuclease